MRFEIDLYCPRDVRAFAQFLLSVADSADSDVKDKVQQGGLLNQASFAPAETQGEAPEPPKRTRGRPRKAAETTPEPEQDQQPEDPEIAEAAESAPEDVMDDAPAEEPQFPPTRDGLKAAMQAHAIRFGMAETQKHGPKLLGAPKLSAVEDADIATAVANLAAAIASGQPGGA
jgi:hypothetical protein